MSGPRRSPVPRPSLVAPVGAMALCALVAIAGLGLARASAAAASDVDPADRSLDAALLDDSAARRAALPEGLRPPDDAGVRRWEYVLLVRTAPEVPDALGRAEVAALKAGAAVLEDMRVEYTASHADHRMLVRTRDPEAVQSVLLALRSTRGVLGASVQPLPETPTYPGGPSFFESYQAPGGTSLGNADRVVMHHDVPPLADKKELLEMTDVLAPPSAGPDGTGGFTLNISELFSRMKEGAWRRREERLRNTPIEILPPEGAADAPSAPQP